MLHDHLGNCFEPVVPPVAPPAAASGCSFGVTEAEAAVASKSCACVHCYIITATTAVTFHAIDIDCLLRPAPQSRAAL